MMDRRTALALLVSALALAARPRALGAQSTQGMAPTPQPLLSAPDPAYLQALRPIIARGAAILPYDIDNGANARSVIFVRVAAPMSTVHRVITTPEHYPHFMPAVERVEVLGRHGNRAAFRFHVGVAIFNASADAQMHVVSSRRVDVSIPHSDFGASASRWDLYPEGPGATIVALTVWADPWQGSWPVRQLVGRSPWAASGAGITVETVLALAVKRRAEILSGARLPLRPSRLAAPAGTLAPPPPGPWMDIARTVNVMALTLDAEGALVQVTALGATSVPAASVIHRMTDVEHYSDVWSWLRTSNVSATPGGSAVRFRLNTASPLADQSGEFVRTLEANNLGVRLDGVSGDFAGESLRWDVVPYAGGSYVMLTAGSDARHVNWMHRALIDRDPWVVPGMSAYWRVVMVRYGLAGLR